MLSAFGRVLMLGLIFSFSVVSLVVAAPPLNQVEAMSTVHKMLKSEPDWFRTLYPFADINQANEINKQAIRDKAIAEFKAKIDAVDLNSAVYEISVSAQASQYDAKRNGFFLKGFGGGEYIGLQRAVFGQGASTRYYAGSVIVTFTNSADFHFISADEGTYRKLLGPNPAAQVTVKLEVQPVGAKLLFEKGYERAWLYLHITSIKVVGNDPVAKSPFTLFETKVDRIPTDKIGKLASTGKVPTAAPTDYFTIAATWHKLAGKNPPGYEAYAKDDDRVTMADEFDRPDRLKRSIDEQKSSYERIDPNAHMLVSLDANLGQYDAEKQQFDLGLSGGVGGFAHQFPYVAQPNSSFMPQFRYSLKVANMEAIRYFKIAPQEAKSLVNRMQSNRRLSIVMVLQPTGADPVDENSNRRSDTDHVIQTKLMFARLMSDATGQVLSEFSEDGTVPVGAGATVQAAGAKLEAAAEPKSAAKSEPAPSAPQPPAPGKSEPASSLADANASEVDVAKIDLKGLKLGGKVTEFLEEAKKVFTKINYDEKRPMMAQLENPEKFETAQVMIDNDQIVFGIRYFRQLQGDQVDGAIDSVIEKYGKPVSDSGESTKGRMIFRTLKWNKPGSVKSVGMLQGGLTVELAKNVSGAKQGILSINIVLPGERKIGPARPPAGAPKEDKPKPKLDL